MTALSADLIDRARAVPVESVIEQHGIKLRGHVDRCGPCPQCGGADRFSINTRKQLFFCRGCNAKGDSIALVQHLDGVGFREAVEILAGQRIEDRPRPPRPPVDRRSDDEREHDKAHWLWRQRKPIAGSLAETYLRQARGYGGAIPATLAFLPPRDDHEPALIAAFGLCSEPEPGELAIDDVNVRAMQLVKLKGDGSGKAEVEPNKIIIGKGALGSPIVLAPPNDLLGLAICEGLEDALSIHEATGLGAWASGGATRLPALANAVPGYIECISIFGHDDGGRPHAIDLAARLRSRGFEVILKFLRAERSP